MISANQRSIWLSHDALVGVKCRWKRGASEKPLVDHRGPVGAVVVEDQVDVQLLRHRLLDDREELPELDGPVARVASPDDFSRGDVEGGEERGGAVALVVVGLAGGRPRTQRKHRLGAVERLDLRLLVHAEHDRPLRRGHVRQRRRAPSR